MSQKVLACADAVRRTGKISEISPKYLPRTTPDRTKCESAEVGAIHLTEVPLRVCGERTCRCARGFRCARAPARADHYVHACAVLRVEDLHVPLRNEVPNKQQILVSTLLEVHLPLR